MSEDPEIDPEVIDLLIQDTNRGARRRKKDPDTRKENSQLKEAYRQAIREATSEKDFRSILHALGWADGSPQIEQFVQLWRSCQRF